MTPPRLDILIYAHDGRGLGHASRGTAVGMALRRLFPEKKVLFISGCKMTASLVGQAPLDWIKLPAYATKVVAGQSKGTRGNSNFSLKELGHYRADIIRRTVESFRPRVVLVDHQPQGKQKELLPAIEATRGTDTQWVLGVRGIVGGVPQVQSSLPRDVFQSRFRALLWYGDASVLGQGPFEALADHFGTQPCETGYVSRLGEFLHWHPSLSARGAPWAGTVSIPWIGENTTEAIACIARALEMVGSGYGQWRLFIGCRNDGEQRWVADRFSHLPFCRVEAPSDLYPEALIHSRFAMIYGGYNSIIDVLRIDKPAVVLMRGMQDGEQEQHLHRLNQTAGAGLAVFPEARLTAKALAEAIHRGLSREGTREHAVNLDGAVNAARRLADMTT